MPDVMLARAHHDSPWSCPDVIARTALALSSVTRVLNAMRSSV
jgi:hypothetical protein